MPEVLHVCLVDCPPQSMYMGIVNNYINIELITNHMHRELAIHTSPGYGAAVCLWQN